MSKHGDKDSNFEQYLVSMLDDFNKFKKYERVMGDLMAMVQKGATVESIYEKYGPALAARMVMMGLSSKDPKQAITMIKEIHDRSLGKSKERQEISHKFENTSDKELDRLINSEEEQVEGLEKEKVH